MLLNIAFKEGKPTRGQCSSSLCNTPIIFCYTRSSIWNLSFNCHTTLSYIFLSKLPLDFLLNSESQNSPKLTKSHGHLPIAIFLTWDCLKGKPFRHFWVSKIWCLIYFISRQYSWLNKIFLRSLRVRISLLKTSLHRF